MSTDRSPRDASAPAHAPIGMPRVARALLRFYPAAWRERYGDELMVMVNGRRLSIREMLDLLRGALDAHCNLADLVGDWSLEISQLRSTAVTTFTAWVMFCAAMCGLVKCIEDPAFARAANVYPALRGIYTVMQMAFALTAIAVLVGGLPLAIVATHQAWQTKDKALARLLSVPIVAAAVVLEYTRFAVRYVNVAGAGVHTPLRITLFSGLMLLLGASAVATVTAVRATVYRIRLSAPLLRWTGWAALVAAGAITAGVVAMAAYGWLLHSDDPALFASANGLLATSLPMNYVAMMAIGWTATVSADRVAILGLNPLLVGNKLH